MNEKTDTMASTFLNMGRQAGVVMHVTSLPGEHGIGDIGESAHAFVDALADMDIGVWQFLPLGPTAYGDSPYQPLSAFAGNANLIGLHQLIELGLLQEREVSALCELPADRVDYGRLIPAKRALLRTASERLLSRSGSSLLAEFEEFQHREQSWLNDYALFRVLKTLHGERPWPEWEESYKQRQAGALQQVADRNRAAVDTVLVTQFLFDRQWRELKLHAANRGVTLFGDIPIYIALDSADAWANREMLLLEDNGLPTHVAGVPPDYFSADGQLWGNPLYDWDYHHRTGYRWWVERMRYVGRQSDLVRIDHFRGFESFWSVPYGEETAKNGEWWPGPGDAIFTTMRDELGPLGIVAEDLGVITPEVDALRTGQGFPGMVVLQFEVGDPAFEMGGIERNSVCYTGTHDNDTTLGWFLGTGDDTRTPDEVREMQDVVLERTGGTADSVPTDMIELAFSSKAALAVAPMQDYLGLGSPARLNTPGTTSNNWCWRMRESQVDAALVENISRMVNDASRAP